MKVYLFVIAGLISGCMTYDPYTGEQQVSKATEGVIAGAAIGAMAGNQVKGSRKTRDQAMIAGAALGAMAGGAYGNRVDRQEASLRQRLQSTGVSISKQGDRIILNMPGSITFDKASSVVKPEFADILNSVAVVLKEYKNSKVDVAGYADSKGSIEVNQHISQQRANAVAAYLRSQGVASSRISAIGYGKSNLVGSDDLSRRVEITLVN